MCVGENFMNTIVVGYGEHGLTLNSVACRDVSNMYFVGGNYCGLMVHPKGCHIPQQWALISAFVDSRMYWLREFGSGDLDYVSNVVVVDNESVLVLGATKS